MRNNRQKKKQPAEMPTPVDPEELAFMDSVYADAVIVANKYKAGDPCGIATDVARRLCARWLKNRKSILDETRANMIEMAVRRECRKADIRGERELRKNWLSLQDGGLVQPKNDGRREMKSALTTDGPVIDKEGRRVAELAIARLRRKPRRVMELRILMEFEYEEIAAALGMSIGAVGRHICESHAEFERIILAYVNDESLPRAIRRQLEKERQ